jgi:Type II site-specific deoxyribonuclease
MTVSSKDELWHLIARLGSGQRAALAKFIAEMGDEGSSRSRLVEALAELDEDGIGRVLTVARAMSRPITQVRKGNSAIVTEAFVAEFQSKLLMHHATHTTKLDRLGFENAFLAASRAAGRATEQAPSRTTRFWDVRVDGEQISLKSEGAASMKADYLHITKLSEAAWIQDVRSAKARHGRMMQLINDFLAAVQGMFVLRSSSRADGPFYELVEIPVALFRRIEELPVAAFDSDAPRIAITDDAGDIMELRLDRSDAKITVAKLRKDRCIVHATWQLGAV